MEKYKQLIAKFVEEIEKLDEECDLEKFNAEEEELLFIIRECRNKLIDVHNKIGDDVWVMPNMRNKVKEYINELDEEINRCESWLEENISVEACAVTAVETRLQTLNEVKCDLESRLEELI